LTREELQKFVRYEPETGLFYWLVSTTNRCKIGDIAGTKQDGYVAIRINGKRDYAHRFALLYMTGDYPAGQIVDHINRDKTDNRWVNLRVASHTTNAHNSPRRVDNKSGYKGVFYNKNCGQKPWFAYINSYGLRLSLGYFATKEEAVVARQKAEGDYA
tara:strand:+ start:240 stop:713 length:474 start_codon:yes stop_codon:yes gene_type:complete